MKKFIITFLLVLTLPIIAKTDSEVFPISTEVQIGKIRNILDKAPKGIYLTVGGERAFRGSSMHEGIEHLIVIDISPAIIRYNKINIELLKSSNKEDYKDLRWNSDFLMWKKISATLTEEDFKWWNENIRNIKGYILPESLNKYGSSNKYLNIRTKLLSIYPLISKKFNNREKIFLNNVTWSDIQAIHPSTTLTKEEFEWFDVERKNPESCVQKFIEEPSTAIEWGQVVDYRSGNYLFDDKLYNRLHNLALANKITVLESDMTKQEGITLVTKTIQKIGVNLAVTDLDNLYLYDYMGEEKFRTALSQLAGLTTKDSILILMNNYKSYPCAQFSIYIGFTFEHIKSWPQEPFFDALINSIPEEVQALMNGRLYEGKDELPFNLMKK